MKVTGVKELELMLKELPNKLNENLFKGFDTYVRKHLVTRMKERLSNATQPMQKSNMGLDGKPKGGGGYGVPENSTPYSNWKASRTNLPLVGNLTTRELAATGHFIESINVNHFKKTKGGFEFGVGPGSGQRPAAVSMSDNPPGSGQANVSRVIDNAKLAEWIEDSKYAWLVNEYEDVQRDVVPLVVHILKKTILQLANKYFNKVTARG